MSKTDTPAPDNAIQRIIDNGGVYSQAQNFLGVVSTDVDPRTGQFMLAINLPTLVANNLSGPTLTPTLSYNAQASLQDKGFGLGWSLLLSELVLSGDSSSLRLSSGEQFAIDPKSDFSVGGTLTFLDHKLQDLLVTRISTDSFRIDRKTGEIEILQRQHSSHNVYYLCEMRTAEGRRLKLSWTGGNDLYRLRSITDETGRVLLETTTPTGGLNFVITPNDTPMTLALRFSNDRLSRVTLTGIEGNFGFVYTQQSVGNGISFLFPETLSGPLGATDEITWTNESNSHKLPEGAPFTHLPRVASWRQSSGTSSNVLTHSYAWQGNRNYLGFGSNQGFDWEDGRDNLYRVEHTYRYTCTETQRQSSTTLATIKRTWNNFHLPVETVTTSGDTETTNSTSYWIDERTGWAGQPAYCQLLREMTTTYRNTKDNESRSETTSYTYDDSGNILTLVHPTGVTETNTYYPADNSTMGCPADALGMKLGMVRFLEKKTTTPAPSDFAAPILSTAYEYENLDSLAAEDQDQPHAVVVKETVTNETDKTVMEITEQTYEKNKTSPHYGRELSAITTLNGKATTTLFAYELADDQLTTQVTVEGHDVETRPASRSVTSSCRSAITGLTEKDISAAGVVTAYEYDALGRLAKTVIAQASSYEAQRTASYYVNDEDFIEQNRPEGIRALVAAEERDASGQCRRIWLDGNGREVCVELEDLDYAPGTFREIARTDYDALGRAITQTSKEWFEGKELFALTSTTEYDDWGTATKVTSPTGVISHTLQDPVKLTTEQWQEGANGRTTAKQITFGNVAGSPIKHELFDEKEVLVCTTELTRDGLDRVVKQTIKVAGKPDIVTQYTYDAYSRVVQQTQPDNTCIAWKYAEHSDGEHPESVEVTTANY